MALLPGLLSDEDPDAVHDLRVWSRRLQQVVVTMFPSPRAEGAREIVRVLRGARRAVSGWRDCDVLLGLLARRMRRVRNPDERRAWESVWAAVEKRRSREIRRARRELARRRLFTLAHDIAQLTGQVGGPNNPAGGAAAEELPAVLAAVADAFERWQGALAHARETRDPVDLHAFRIETKRLRYRIELARDLGAVDSEPALEWLRTLQDGLGRMHDRAEAARVAAEALAAPMFLASEPAAASLLLRRLARELKARHAEAAALLSGADAEASRLERWVKTRCVPRRNTESMPPSDGKGEDP